MEASESVCRSYTYFSPTSIVTSTGLGFRRGTTRIWVTLPMVTPSSETTAPILQSAGIGEVTAQHNLAREQSAG